MEKILDPFGNPRTKNVAKRVFWVEIGLPNGHSVPPRVSDE